MILSCQNISKAFGLNEVIKQGSFHLEDYEKALHTYGSLGLEVQVTELDIHATDASEEGMQMLAERYGKLFRILLNAKKKGLANVTSVTFWGMKDDESWLTGFRKEKSYPLLFGEGYTLKKSYEAVMKVPIKA